MCRFLTIVSIHSMMFVDVRILKERFDTYHLLCQALGALLDKWDEDYLEGVEGTKW